MAKLKPIRIAIVRLGRAGSGMHGPELQGREDTFQIVTGCDLDAEHRQRFQEKCG